MVCPQSYRRGQKEVLKSIDNIPMVTVVTEIKSFFSYPPSCRERGGGGSLLHDRYNISIKFYAMKIETIITFTGKEFSDLIHYITISPIF